MRETFGARGRGARLRAALVRAARAAAFTLPLLAAAHTPALAAPPDAKDPHHAAGTAQAAGESGHGQEAHDAGHGEQAHDAGHGAGHGPGLGAELGLPWIVPFVGILLSIAIFPLVAQHFWHEHYPKVAFAWALVFAVPFLLVHGKDAFHAILHIYLLDYFPFIILLWGLFTVAGGIVVRGSLRGTPTVNTVLLGIGTLLASWVGTTGAAMVLIRPILRANAHRAHKTHVIIFFIFLVANIGGSLTPLGDPPLFLGFLHGVPFFWTLVHMPIPMLTVAVVLLVQFFLFDTIMARHEDVPPPEPTSTTAFGLAGTQNLVLLGGIIGAVLMSGLWHPGEFVLAGIHLQVQNVTRDALIVGIGLLSLRITRRAYRRENEFSWGPIREVAYLFAGIFMTIIPALEILKAGENGALAGLIRAVKEPWHYFWVTGTLSAFLDNAPTYLTFFNTALGGFYPGVPEKQAVLQLIAEQNVYLLAISTGAVFMGACSYIGNAPNFMVKSIAEEAGIDMPSFFGYIVRWTLPFLIPPFVLVTLLFLV